jgi:hypothetical protein
MVQDRNAADRSELRRAVRDCRERGLYESAKWAALNLGGLPPAPGGDSPAVDHSSDRSAPDPSLTSAESDSYDLALCHFDVRVSDSVVVTLYAHPYTQRAPCTPTPPPPLRCRSTAAQRTSSRGRAPTGPSF